MVDDVVLSEQFENIIKKFKMKWVVKSTWVAVYILGQPVWESVAFPEYIAEPLRESSCGGIGIAKSSSSTSSTKREM